jgi:hypothetical protein
LLAEAPLRGVELVEVPEGSEAVVHVVKGIHANTLSL